MVIFTFINTSTERQTVIVNASIPILIFFYDLNIEINLTDYIKLTNEFTWQSQTGLSQPSQPSKQLIPHGQSKVRIIPMNHKL